MAHRVLERKNIPEQGFDPRSSEPFSEGVTEFADASDHSGIYPKAAD